MVLALPAASAVKGFFLSKKFLIPAAILALFLAVGAGTYFYIKNQTDEKVTAAVETANSTATIKTFETLDQVTSAYSTIDQKADAKERQTIKDYQYVTYRIESAPMEQKTAPVPPLIIDTLNELDRLRAVREAGHESGIPDAEVPVG